MKQLYGMVFTKRQSNVVVAVYKDDKLCEYVYALFVNSECVTNERSISHYECKRKAELHEQLLVSLGYKGRVQLFDCIEEKGGVN